jgi:hypothetical protein
VADDAPVERVRADLARLGNAASSAADVPPAVTDRVVSALRAEGSVARSPRHTLIRLSAAVGVTAALAAAGIGTAMVARMELTDAAPAHQLTTTPPPPATVPLSDSEILALLNRPPDLGALDDLRRRASCLSGLGYPGSASVLGGQQLQIQGSPAVLILLPGDTPETVVALAVRPNCSSADTGLLADTQIRRL